ncbi:hypothetical protein PX669_19210 (plasmid) [Acinetobacter soli]|nr:hypothetical protein PX669_19210 [Acinetobacter soli]
MSNIENIPVKDQEKIDNTIGNLEQDSPDKIDSIESKTDPVEVVEDVIDAIKSAENDVQSEPKKPETDSVSEQVQSDSKEQGEKKTYQTSFFDNMDDLTGSK